MLWSLEFDKLVLKFIKFVLKYDMFVAIENRMIRRGVETSRRVDSDLEAALGCDRIRHIFLPPRSLQVSPRRRGTEVVDPSKNWIIQKIMIPLIT